MGKNHIIHPKKPSISVQRTFKWAGRTTISYEHSKLLMEERFTQTGRQRPGEQFNHAILNTGIDVKRV